jgi:signal transduction histidine kinase
MTIGVCHLVPCYAVKDHSAGLIDLSQIDFNSTKKIKLGGEWLFYEQVLLFPFESSTTKPVPTKVPSSWDNEFSTDQFGYGTYVVTITLPKNHLPLGINFPFIGSAARVWVDRTLTFEKGRVGTNAEEHRGGLGNIFIHLPNGAETVTLTIQVSNYNHFVGGLVSMPEIGITNAIQRDQDLTKGWYNIFAGSLIAMAIIHLMLFGLYRRGQAYLFLALICTCVSLRTFILNRGSLFLPDVFPEFDLSYFKRLEYFVVFAMLILFPHYISTSFKGRCPQKPVMAFTIVGAILCMATLLLSPILYIQALDFAHTVFLIEFVFAAYVLFKNRKESETSIILIGIGASFPLILLEILANSNIIQLHADHLLELGVLIFFLFQVFILAKKNAIAYFTSERLNRTLEQQVAQRTQELSQLNQVKNSLLMIISHDLKSPIQTINGVLHLFNSGHIAEHELRPLMKQMELDFNSTTVLLDNVLSWSASQAEGIKIKKRKIELYWLVEEHIRLFKKQADHKGLILSNKLEKNLQVLADDNVLRLMLRNLLSNALKFTPRGGVIDIFSMVKDRVVDFCVRDSGTGMSPETLQTLFNGEQTSIRGTGNEKGHGLGLSLCKKFLNEMGTNIYAESELSKGTIITVPLEPYREEIIDSKLAAQYSYQD